MILILQIAAGIFIGFLALFAFFCITCGYKEYRRTGRWPKNWT